MLEFCYKKYGSHNDSHFIVKNWLFYSYKVLLSIISIKPDFLLVQNYFKSLYRIIIYNQIHFHTNIIWNTKETYIHFNQSLIQKGLRIERIVWSSGYCGCGSMEEDQVHIWKPFLKQINKKHVSIIVLTDLILFVPLRPAISLDRNSSFSDYKIVCDLVYGLWKSHSFRHNVIIGWPFFQNQFFSLLPSDMPDRFIHFNHT